jgi:hypothetical protein
MPEGFTPFGRHRHYRAMRENQTVDFYRRMEEKYTFADGACRARMTIREAFKALEVRKTSIPHKSKIN